MTMLGLTVLMEMAAKTNNAPRWFGRVLETEEDIPVRMTLNFEVRRERRGARRTHGKKI